MKPILPLVILTISLAACAAPAAGPAPMAAPIARADAERLAELYRRQDCFGLRDALEGMQGGAVVDFYRAASAVAFNRPDESAEASPASAAYTSAASA